ncbi:MAG: hypothetical protein HY692_05150, partial [Cyanobacteria bacterium NC_groundwater_1444_Ag_S-0.65um_54_12]|nr:hypothetical protein [Cyanobacteria bacterium NC_groundwater_1444_Ag_S-0.65um_54_12]
MDRYWLVVLLLVLASCSRPWPVLLPASAPAADFLLAGVVRWVDSGKKNISATTREIASGATVSLIDPTNGQTVATTVTAPGGAFSLALPNWRPSVDKPYLLEAAKGLSSGGFANRVGAVAARLRTVVSRSDGKWVSLTGERIQISRSTTAIAAIAGLKGLGITQLRTLLGKITVAIPDVFTETPEISASDFSAVWGLVDSALALNLDPLRTIAWDNASDTFALLERGPLVTDLSVANGAVGETITIYGNGFDPVAANNLVRFNGANGAIMAVATMVNPIGTQLTVPVPSGAVTGQLTVQVGNIVMVAANNNFKVAGTTIDTYAGGLNQPPAGTLTLDWPIGNPNTMAQDNSGNLYFSTDDMVYRLASDGTITAVAGNGVLGYSGDGGPATDAELTCTGIAIDDNNNIYITTGSDNRIRKVNNAGIIT